MERGLEAGVKGTGREEEGSDPAVGGVQNRC